MKKRSALSYFSLSIFLTSALLFSCKNTNEEVSNEEQVTDSLVTDVLVEPELWCFAEKTKAMINTEEDNFNYHFIQLKVNPDKTVVGWYLSSPYGTDSGRGHLSGTYDVEKVEMRLESDAYGEGMRFSNDIIYPVTNEGLSLGNTNADNSPAILEKVECDAFDLLWNSYSKDILKYSLNTTDRSRLLKVKGLDLTSAQLKEVRFLEKMVDLDHDYKTEEYLLYIMDPMLCGTGGCNLLIIDGNGKILSETSVTKLPIYTDIVTSEELQTAQKSWSTLYVWSNGSYRKITHDGTKYLSNASDGETISEDDIMFHPEKYFLLMNYLD